MWPKVYININYASGPDLSAGQPYHDKGSEIENIIGIYGLSSLPKVMWMLYETYSDFCAMHSNL